MSTSANDDETWMRLARDHAVAIKGTDPADTPIAAILVLDDSDSLMPTARLSQTKEVEVTARLSATGSADRSDADIEAAPVRFRLPHAEAIELVIGAR